ATRTRSARMKGRVPGLRVGRAHASVRMAHTGVDMANVNEPRFVAFPKEVLTGVLADDVTPDDVTAVLHAAGVSAEAVRFLQGEEGLRILDPEGDRGSLKQRLQRKVEHLTAEGKILAEVAGQLEAGHTIVGIFGVKK